MAGEGGAARPEVGAKRQATAKARHQEERLAQFVPQIRHIAEDGLELLTPTPSLSIFCWVCLI